MPIKKSVLLLIILSVGSVSLLVFSKEIPSEETLMPIKCTGAKCSSQLNEPKTFSAWDLVSQIVLRPVA